MSSIYIGHSSIAEDGTMYGTAGDQTGKEVCIREFWNAKSGWKVLRPYDEVVGQRLAQAMIELCRNDMCGYNASTKQRNSGILLLVKYGRISDIKEPFNTDCSSAIRLCCRQAGINLPNFTTKSEIKTLEGCGYFNKAFDYDALTKLQEGDVLVTSGHTVIVVSTTGNPDKVDIIVPKQKKISKLLRFLGK